jgi:[glutamine synthetase] adenylyltransferase / [glutamine synthetase]-adenylyl-L-tyrosine phosphorylase
MLRITVGRSAREELPDASALALLRALGSPVDLPTLRATLDDLAQQVRALFVRYIGEIHP